MEYFVWLGLIIRTSVPVAVADAIRKTTNAGKSNDTNLMYMAYAYYQIRDKHHPAPNRMGHNTDTDLVCGTGQCTTNHDAKMN